MGQSACCGFDHRACSLLWRLLWPQAVGRSSVRWRHKPQPGLMVTT
ncbi:Hypothetical protein RY67_305 [Bifidobacterium longum subsp. infantis]|uniref:Uncharacterized protein n=1 Tax=Bifidobacterium longum subsp. infantis TaxID=1682 RepID=A0A0M5KUS6_BIFLI|nr:Hypothetical protein RY67_305 [Bifidobacterium longum subsp. infantis]